MASPPRTEEDEDAFNWGEDMDATELAGNIDADADQDLDWTELEDRTTPEPAVVSVPDSGQSSAEFESPQNLVPKPSPQTDEATHADSSPKKAQGPALALQPVTAQTAVHQSEIEAEEQPDEPRHSPPAAAAAQEPSRERQGSSGGWGLKSAWGLGAIGGLAKAVAGVASEAVRDVTELTGSFQQALAQVDDGDTDEEEEEARQRLQQQREAGVSSVQAPAPQTLVRDAPVVEGHTLGVQEKDAASASQKSEDEEDGQVLDAQVEQLTAGAAKALSSLWGGLSGIARSTVTVVSKVEAATKGLAHELVTNAGVGQDVAQLTQAAKGVATNVTRLGTRLERGLETVGRTAMGFLEEFALNPEGGAQGREQGGMDPHAGGEPQTYADFFNLYGGTQLSDDLEKLANDCARTCNRSRSKLEGSQQQELDTALSTLGPIFSGALTSGSAPAVAGDAGSKEAAQQLEQRYAPILYLVQDSVARAQAFKHMLQVAAEQDASAPAAATTKDAGAPKREAEGAEEANAAATAGSTPVPEGASASSPADTGKSKEDGADKEGGEEEAGGSGWDEVEEPLLQGAKQEEAEGKHGKDEASAQAQEAANVATAVTAQGKVSAALASLQAHAAKRMAELTTAQVQLLCDHATSLSTSARSGADASGGITWPPEAVQVAALLRTQAVRMVTDLNAVTGAYTEAASSLPPKTAPEVAQGTELGTAEEQEQQLQGELSSAQAQARNSIESGFRSLLYPVLARELVTRVAAASSSV